MAYKLPTKTLGRTGLVVTRLGIGGAYCKTPEGYVQALECGVTYVDTARSYHDGEDERILGQALAGWRDKLTLATKSGSRDAEGAKRDLETSLTLLRTDHVDIWQVHYLNKEEEKDQALGKGGIVEYAMKAREEGLIRFLGVTGHNWPVVAQAAATGLFDTVLCWYNCALKQAETTVFPEAVRHNMGVVIMNATRNDRLFGDPAAGAPRVPEFYRYVLTNPAVTVTIVGLRNLERFAEIAAGLEEREILSADEIARLERYGAEMLAAGKLEMP